MKTVCVLGGYGVFGSRIIRALVRDAIPVIIAGRTQKPANQLAKELKQQYPHANIQTAIFDVRQSIANNLNMLRPTVLINTCGPFQISDFSIATTCIALGIHYIDLADARDFVNQIQNLDETAKKNQVMVISGASTVPGLTSAVIEHFQPQFKQITSLDFGISPGAKTPRGTATTKAILSYLGKPLKPFPGGEKAFGWQNLHSVVYPEIGRRWMGNCDVPDLDLLPQKYHISQLRFVAGMESGLLHLGIWGLSWLVRLGLPINLMKYADLLLRLSHIFDVFGTDEGGMHIILKGIDHNNNPLIIKWFIIVKKGDGPYVPTVPAVILAKKIIANTFNHPGAQPCLGLVGLTEYLQEMGHYASSDHVSTLRY